MANKHLMPKNKRQFEACLESAFLEGCSWGYCVEHTNKIAEQEQIGADQYLGRISREEASAKIEAIWAEDE